MQLLATYERGCVFTVLALACASAVSGGCGGRAITATRDGGGAAGASATDATVEHAAPTPDAADEHAAPSPDAAVEHAAPSPDAAIERAAPSPDAGFVASIDWFCEQKASAVCAFLIDVHLAYADDADCRTAEKARCLVPVADWEASAASDGRLVFDPLKVDACLAAPLQPSACDAVLAGRLAGGQPC